MILRNGSDNPVAIRLAGENRSFHLGFGFGVEFILSLILLGTGDDGGELGHGTTETAARGSVAIGMVVPKM
jgi:hypothetical protein